MQKFLIFDKGGRKKRIKLIKKNQAPRDFFQSIDFLRSNNFNIEHFFEAFSNPKLNHSTSNESIQS